MTIRRGVVVGAAAAILLGACGGGGGGDTGGATNNVTMTDFKFSPNHMDLKGPSATLHLVNKAAQLHDMVVIDKDGKVMGRSQQVSGGDSADLQLSNLAAGDYKFFCDLPGHRESGMEGTLTVK